MPSRSATARARPAIPGRRSPRPRSGPRRRIPGITFSVAMPAVERTPQRRSSWAEPQEVSVAVRVAPWLPSLPSVPGPAGAGVITGLTRARQVYEPCAGIWKRGTQTRELGRDEVGQRSETVRRANLSAIVRALHEAGPLSRSELVEPDRPDAQRHPGPDRRARGRRARRRGRTRPPGDAGPPVAARPARPRGGRGPGPRDRRRLDRGRPRRAGRHGPRAGPGGPSARPIVGRRGRGRAPRARGPDRRPKVDGRAGQRNRRRCRRRRATRRRPRLDGTEPGLDRRAARGAAGGGARRRSARSRSPTRPTSASSRSIAAVGRRRR